jgi:murein DD-endopeptidase MepM/ murein hydrolase activator NlpD
MALALPGTAGASWPFSAANAESNPSPILHDASLNLMAAPISTYTDAYFDGYSPDTVDGSALDPNLSSDDDISSSSLITEATTTPAPDTSSAPNNGSISTYTVQEGDNLSTIAAQYGVSMNTILWANDITNPSTIKPGTKLVILPVSGIQHTVRSGETLSSIAEKFGGNADDIAQFNGIADGSSLQVGSTIIIPGGELSASSSGDKVKSSSGKTASNKSSTSSESSSGDTVVSHVATTVSVSGGSPTCADTSDNPCHGIDGAALHGFFTDPLPGALVTQGLHGWDAVDLGAHTGTPILAAAGGTVMLSRMGGWNGGYGNYVIIDNGSGVETLYAHMSETKASAGDNVSAGQVIGYVGMTGDATGPHLHFEVRGARNPFAFCEGGSADACFSD